MLCALTHAVTVASLKLELIWLISTGVIIYEGISHVMSLIGKGTWRFGRAVDCLTSHTCIPCSTHKIRGIQRVHTIYV